MIDTTKKELMMLTYLDATADAETVSSVLRSDGVVAVTGLVDPEIADTVAAELRPDLDSKGLKTVDAFNGDKTNRYGGVLRTAPSAAALIDHDLVIAVANDVFLPHAASYRINSLAAIEIMPGETHQALHRDDTVYPIDVAGMELTLGVMWSLSDFTAENGGTRVVPGSHRFLRSWHQPDLSNWDNAGMPRGASGATRWKRASPRKSPSAQSTGLLCRGRAQRARGRRGWVESTIRVAVQRSWTSASRAMLDRERTTCSLRRGATLVERRYFYADREDSRT